MSSSQLTVVFHKGVALRSIETWGGTQDPYARVVLLDEAGERELRRRVRKFTGVAV